MFEIEGRTRLQDMTRILVDTAMGRQKADLVVRNANLVNVNTAEIIEKQDVAVKKDRIALVGDARTAIGSDTQVIDAAGRHLVPGFIDGHLHIESSMVTATQFARAVIPHGTTTVFVDPHEITNVLGLDGVRFFIDESRGLPLNVLITVASCVPAAPGFETAGGVIGAKEIEEAMKWRSVVALGEMMNYPGVLSSDPQVHAEIAATLNAGRLVEGHAVDLLGNDLAAYAAAGITSCHESTKKIQALEKLRFGMYAMLRESSASPDIAETIRVVTEEKLDPRHVTLVTDDREPKSILDEGHMDHVLRRAIQEGVDPVRAIQMATLNVAEHYECARELGSIAPARLADMVILDDLKSVAVSTVIADGRVVSENGKVLTRIHPPVYPSYVRNTVRFKKPPSLDDLEIVSKTEKGSVRVRAIGVIPASIQTKHLQLEAPVKNRRVQVNPDEDLVKIAVFERHRGTGNRAVGFIKGLGIKEGAVASTVAHDSHNLVIAGASDKDMVLAAKTLLDTQGGLVVIRDERVLAHLALPIAGLMSDKPVENVAESVEQIRYGWKKLGSELPSPYMTLSFTSLSVIPELRITDKGLLDTVQFKFVPTVVS